MSRAGLFRQLRAPGHPFRRASDQLDDHQRQAVAHRSAAHDIGAATGEAVARHHLGRDIGRAETRRGAPEGQVGDTGHRRCKHAPGYRDIADL